MRLIMSSDEDCPIVEDLTAGFDNRNNLIILIEHIDYDDPRRNCRTYASVDMHEASKLAKRLKVSITGLPGLIAESMDDYAAIINAGLSDVQACFKEITECLLDEGCRFRIARQPGRNGFLCC